MQQSPAVGEQMISILQIAFLAEEEYGEYYVKLWDTDGFYRGNLFPPRYFKFDSDGITFMWPPYWIASGASGTMKVTVPYSKVEKYLTEKGADILASIRNRR
ncbi:hypothetical protein FACS189483_09180 [Spirochaetia bacterium]|nr:hypothetical protein FACS189483_09180 [Spirochaetia bacterium]